VTNYIVRDFTNSNNGSPNQTLDTSNLEKVDMGEDSPSLPIEYSAPSTEVALKSLPFNVKLPKDLPFDHNPFVVTSIQDIKRDGKTVRILIQANSKNNSEIQLFTILATNQKAEISKGEEVRLDHHVKGSFNNTLSFEQNGVYYRLDIITEKQISLNAKKKIFIEIANQIL
jgi:hypothetical protein